MLTTIAITVAMFHTNADDVWEPPNEPDLHAILQEAGKDTREGRYAVALAKHFWFHENSVKLDPAMTGVRLSFALSSWLQLAEKYEPALRKLQEVRDKTEALVRDEKKVRVRFEDFHDLVALNKTLRLEKQTVEVFRWLDKHHSEDAERMFRLAQPALVKEKEYSLCGKYVTADDFAAIELGYSHLVKRLEKKPGERLKDFAEKSYINKSSTLVAILMLSERPDQAQSVAQNARRLVARNEKLLKRLNRSLGPALEGKVPNPWP